MGKWTQGIAVFAGCGVGLGMLATGPAGSSWGALAMREHSHGPRHIDGGRHEAAPIEEHIKVSRVVSATPSECWRLWTTSEGVGTFLTPNNNIELAVGGAYEIYFVMDNPEGQRGSEDCKVLSYLPERMLSFEWNAPPHFPEVREKRSRVVVRFDEMAEGTKVELTHLGFGSGEQWAKVHEYFTLAWPQVMDRFAAALGG